MTFGIIGAMEEEIIYIKSKMEILNSREIIGTVVYAGKMNGQNVVLARCGIGKVNAAVCTQMLIDLYNVDCVINTGIAGSMNADVHLGDVVISTKLVQHDFDATSFDDDEPGFIPRMGVKFFEADKTLCDLAYENANGVLAALNAKAHKGIIATGDQFIDDTAVKARIAHIFNPLCVEMEGAAIAHACYLNNIAFIVIRAISDNSDGDIKTYENYVDIAAKNSSAIVEKIIEAYIVD